MQDSLLLAFVHLRHFDGRSSFSTWLTRITINSALMILRKKRATPLAPFEEISKITKSAPPAELSDPGPSPEVFYMQRERKRILSMAMKELTPAVRKVIELRDLRELSIQETARVLGLSVSAVKGRVFHGRRKLRQVLQPNGESACQHGRPVVGGIQFRSSCFFNARKRRSVYEAA
jgi:RNA polymerase sigma-70 factor, ECF subfamily